MLAIALVLEGTSRKAAAESCGVERQTLRDWVHRYNRASTSSNRRWNRLLSRKRPWRFLEKVA
ncbi:helix-turn-helix domain-containing protein [Roseovarius sp. MMSF_3281]|uniref:helix-turn-helix domain-containing protein n=1 Tax=Roseovarius sp. MMSF_3281 TaxID=3046694 RepID=UPI003531ED1D